METILLIPMVILVIGVSMLAIHLILVQVNNNLSIRYGYDVYTVVKDVIKNNPGFPPGDVVINDGFAYTNEIVIQDPTVNIRYIGYRTLYGVINLNALSSISYNELKRDLGLGNLYDITIDAGNIIKGFPDPAVYSYQYSQTIGGISEAIFNGYTPDAQENIITYGIASDTVTGEQAYLIALHYTGSANSVFSEAEGKPVPIYYQSNPKIIFRGSGEDEAIAVYEGNFLVEPIYYQIFIHDISGISSNQLTSKQLNFYAVINTNTVPVVPKGHYVYENSATGSKYEFTVYNLPPTEASLLIGVSNPSNLPLTGISAYYTVSFGDLKPVTGYVQVPVRPGYTTVNVIPPKDEWNAIVEIAKQSGKPFIKVHYSVYVVADLYGKKYYNLIEGSAYVEVYPVWFVNPKTENIKLSNGQVVKATVLQTTVGGILVTNKINNNVIIGYLTEDTLSKYKEIPGFTFRDVIFNQTSISG